VAWAHPCSVRVTLAWRAVTEKADRIEAGGRAVGKASRQ
jgi:hypothetical protein